ncbi:MAG: hypothetical protein RML15_03735 [Bacteroidota bacterium]|nr:hypothetical protein [Candidatus Kapabacteria bacterium]MCS7302248.1 hypothetical protein [Candidatus Kapabacteria bacterium]MDW8271507.1 hypothetical protein [Bacteroidota bacterium]
MAEIASLATAEGREYFRSLYMILRYEQQRGAWETLRLLWLIATRERSLQSYGLDVTIRHRLGITAGTRLWLEEIVSRYYYSTVLSFVYGGAAILLVVVGMRRFSAGISDTIVLLSIGLEALLLLVLFIVLFVTPGEDPSAPVTEKLEEIVREIGEISREHAASTTALEEAVRQLRVLTQEINKLSDSTAQAVAVATQAVSPAPETIQRISQVSQALDNLRQSIEHLTAAARALERENISAAVRTELEKLLSLRVESITNPPRNDTTTGN